MDKGTGKTVERTVIFVIGRAGHDYFIALKLASVAASFLGKQLEQ